MNVPDTQSDEGKGAGWQDALFGSSETSGRIKLFRYLSVGLISALLDVSIFAVAHHVFGAPIWLSNILAIMLSTIFNFIMNRSWAFNSSSHVIRSLVLYLLLLGFNTAFSTYAILGLTNLGLPAVAAKIATMFCIVCWNFVLYRKLIFVSPSRG